MTGPTPAPPSAIVGKGMIALWTATPRFLNREVANALCDTVKPSRIKFDL